jgi:hypothetical protein
LAALFIFKGVALAVECGMVKIMVRIGSRIWSPIQIERLVLLLDSGVSATIAAVELKRSVIVVRAKARNLGRPFPTPEL